MADDEIFDFPTFRLPPKERAKVFADRYAQRPALTPEQDALLMEWRLAYEAEREELRRAARAAHLAAVKERTNG